MCWPSGIRKKRDIERREIQDFAELAWQESTLIVVGAKSLATSRKPSIVAHRTVRMGEAVSGLALRRSHNGGPFGLWKIGWPRQMKGLCVGIATPRMLGLKRHHDEFHCPLGECEPFGRKRVCVVRLQIVLLVLQMHAVPNPPEKV